MDDHDQRKRMDDRRKRRTNMAVQTCIVWGHETQKSRRKVVDAMSTWLHSETFFIFGEMMHHFRHVMYREIDI